MIGAIEQAIVGRLAGLIGDVPVEAFPDDPAGYVLRHRRGAILVAYGRGRPYRQIPVDVVTQDRELQWDVHLLMRHLRSHEGAYAYLDAVRLALTGWKYPGAGTKMVPGPDRFVGHRDGVWSYLATYQHRVPVVEAGEDELLPLLKQITTTDDYGNTEVTGA